MGFLAAHEIGELSAILGDSLPLHELRDLDSRMEWCWQWLKDHSKRDFEPAVEVALQDYRRRLIGMATRGASSGESPFVGVLPSEYARLLAWCERNDLNSVDLSAEDPYMEMVAGDRRDRIRLRSLFADGCTTERQLPSACFAVPPADAPVKSPWKLAEGRLPQFGAFLKELGSLSAVFDQAKSKATLFGLDGEGGARLTKVTTDPLARGLIVLFQLLKRDYRNFREWEDLFKNGAWCAEELTISTAPASTTLERTLDSILSTLVSTSAEEEWLYLEEVAETVKLPTQALRWHLGLLVEEGAILQREEDFGTVYRFGRPRQGTPPVPASGPDGFERVGTHLRSFLRDSLGISSKNDNQIGLTLNSAFVQFAGTLSEQARAGRKWLEAFLAGKGSAWLVHVCRQYAREELTWLEEASWPEYIR